MKQQLWVIASLIFLIAMALIACSLGGRTSNDTEVRETDYGILVVDYKATLASLVSIVDEYSNADHNNPSFNSDRYFSQVLTRLHSLAELRTQIAVSCHSKMISESSCQQRQPATDAWWCPMQHSDIQHLFDVETRIKSELDQYRQYFSLFDPHECQTMRSSHVENMTKLLLHLGNYCDCMMSGMSGGEKNCCANGFDDSGYCDRDDNSIN